MTGTNQAADQLQASRTGRLLAGLARAAVPHDVTGRMIALGTEVPTTLAISVRQSREMPAYALHYVDGDAGVSMETDDVDALLEAVVRLGGAR